MGKWEEKALDWLNRHLSVIAFVFITVIALWVRAGGMAYVSSDYTGFLLPWFNELKAGGGLNGLGASVGDYYIPYLLFLSVMTCLPFEPLMMIKVTSIFFEFLCAFMAVKLTNNLAGKKKYRQAFSVAVYAIVLLSPVIVLNGAFWAQCDYIYGTFILGSLYFLRRKKLSCSFIFLGLALVFKLQTVFILPVFLLCYLVNRGTQETPLGTSTGTPRRTPRGTPVGTPGISMENPLGDRRGFLPGFSIKKFLWLPLIYGLAGLPAIFFGRPFQEVYTIYLRQTELYQQLSMNVPNIWRIFPLHEYEPLAALGIGAVMVIWVVLAVYFSAKGYRLNFQTFFLFSLVAEGLCVMILPAMHERYAAVFCLLAALYFLRYDFKRIWLALLFQFIMLVSCNNALFEMELNLIDYYIIFGIMNVSALLYLLKYALTTVRETNLPITGEAGLAAEEEPAATGEAGLAAEEEPAVTGEADLAAEEEPIATEEADLAMKEEPIATGKGKGRKIPMLILAVTVFLLLLLTAERFIIDMQFPLNREFRTDIRTAIERYPEYIGSRVYLENARNKARPQNVWEMDLRWEARHAGRLEWVDGGVPVFIEDQEGILILSKSLWPEYADVLTGRVILLDGSDYLVFCNEFY